MNAMNYREYSAKVEIDPIDRIFVGHILGIRDIVGFHGRTVEELEAAFQEAGCRERRLSKIALAGTQVLDPPRFDKFPKFVKSQGRPNSGHQSGRHQCRGTDNNHLQTTTP